MRVLAADIGGTHTRFLLADVTKGVRKNLLEMNYASQDYPHFTDVLNRFLDDNGISHIDAACIAVAGPVKNAVAKVTNLPWEISEQQLRDCLHTPHVKLINDFIAQAYGVIELDDSETLLLQQAKAEPVNRDAVVVGAGTGLGAAHLVWMNDHYQAFASEAGHTRFAPANQQQVELLLWLMKQYDYVSLETLLSGGGLYRIYQFMRDVTGLKKSAEIERSMQLDDPARVITRHALLEDDPLCMQSLDCFIDIYGSAAGDIVLHHYPVSELYITGGIAAQIQNQFRNQRFIEALINKGPMTENLKEMNIKLVLQQKTGLYGALNKAVKLL